MIQPLIELKTEQKRYSLYIACAIILILIAHLSADKIDWLQLITFNVFKLPKLPYSINNYATFIKSILFIISLSILGIPVIRDVYQIGGKLEQANIIKLMAAALGVFLLISLFSFQFGVLSNGEVYSQRAINPFAQKGDLYSTRLLMPAMAYFLFFRGNWAYYFFSIIITFAFIAALYHWNKNNINLAWWKFFSVCTASFVFFQFQVPGYPDILLFLFFLMIMFDDFSQESKLTFLLLSLIIHEVSFFIGLILAWRYLGRKEISIYIFAVFFYILVWVLISGLSFSNALATHKVSEMSGLEWVVRHPARELFGIFISYKALWVLLTWSIIVGIKNKLLDDVAFIVANLGAGILMTLLAVDTSRLMGFAFPGLLISLSILQKDATNIISKRLLSFIYFVNILIPSVYVGLNGGVFTWPGIYHWVYEWFYLFLIGLVKIFIN